MSSHNPFPVLLSVDITETDLTYVIKADISGYRAESVHVTPWQDCLIIEMDANHEPSQSYYLGELDSDHYRRVIPLGFTIDDENFYTQYSPDTLEVCVMKPAHKRRVVTGSNTNELA